MTDESIDRLKRRGGLTTLHKFGNFAGGRYPDGGIALGLDDSSTASATKAASTPGARRTAWGTVFRIVPSQADQ